MVIIDEGTKSELELASNHRTDRDLGYLGCLVFQDVLCCLREKIASWLQGSETTIAKLKALVKRLHKFSHGSDVATVTISPFSILASVATVVGAL